MIDSLLQYDVFEWLALLGGLLYAFFTILNNPICWLFGIVSCACIAYKDFTDYQLYFDFVLQIIYIFLGIIGLYNWYKQREDPHNAIIFLPLKSHLNALFLGSILAFLLAFGAQILFDPAFAILDSFTTIFSIWATWLLTNRVYENWIYWIFINITYIGIYYSRGGELIAFLFLIYLMTAVAGLINWLRLHKQSVV